MRHRNLLSMMLTSAFTILSATSIEGMSGTGNIQAIGANHRHFR